MIWFFENVTNNTYHELFVKVLDITLNYGGEKIAISILFKLGLISNLNNANNFLTKNNVTLYQWNLDSFLNSIKKLVNIIFMIQ